MYASYFSYHLTRPYPFRWFTWVVVIGGIAATVLFSCLNLAANGYYLKTIHTTDPNTTLSQTRWFSKAPWSWTNNLEVSCEAQDLAVGTSVFTSNRGLSYKLDRVWRDVSPGKREIYPSLSYTNNTLEDCDVEEIQMSMRSLAPQARGLWQSWAASTALGIATCRVGTADPPYMVNLTTEFNPRSVYIAQAGGEGEGLYSRFSYELYVELDPRERASLWWGSSLSSIWYIVLCNGMAYFDKTYGDEDETPINYTAGSFYLRKNQTEEVASLDFFNISYSYLEDDGRFTWGPVNATKPLSQWIDLPDQVDGFGKSLYSNILVDLGASKPPNLFLDEDLIKSYLLRAYNASEETLRTSRNFSFPDGSSPNITQSYEVLSPKVGALGTEPATIFTQYVCSIPKLKDTRSLIISILVADLVFLQASWALLNLLASLWLEKKDPEANFCPGCATTSSLGETKKESGQEYSLVSLPGGGESRSPVI